MTPEQLARAEALSRYLTARLRLEAAIEDEGAALRHWDSMSREWGPGPAVHAAWTLWARTMEVREREARALGQATEELQDAMRATREVSRG
ncbi:hypothetical protein ACN28S_23945 [Cystobacter fuscus]